MYLICLRLQYYYNVICKKYSTIMVLISACILCMHITIEIRLLDVFDVNV